MPYNTEDEIRTYAGNLLDTDITDPNITDYLTWAFARVQRRVGLGLTPLTNSSLDYGTLKGAEAKFATAYVLKAYGPEFLDKVDDLIIEAKEELAEVVEFGEVEEEDEGAEELIERTDFKSWGKNADLDPPNRMKGLSTGTESEINF